MIMVDQLREPRWLPADEGSVDAVMPNIAKLRNHSLVFPNYFVSAAACTPSRSTLLTGLYTQQTCMFRTQGNDYCTPSLDTRFPTFAKALTQVPGYNAYWIGKWHLSDPAPFSSGIGPEGPRDYGFTIGTAQNLPPDHTLASPNGTGNLGTDGNNPSGWRPPMGPDVPHLTHPSFDLYNDAAICDWFLDRWLPFVPTDKPWCTTVSFVDPHDITKFPYAYAPDAGQFGQPVPPPSDTSPFSAFYAPPPAGSNDGSSQREKDDKHLPQKQTLYSTSSPPADWNVLDNPLSQPYNGGTGKPGLQLVDRFIKT